MSELKNEVVLTCRGCGRPVVCTHLSTAQADPEMKLLDEFIKNLQRIALCEHCNARRAYLAERGRGQELRNEFLY